MDNNSNLQRRVKAIAISDDELIGLLSGRLRAQISILQEGAQIFDVDRDSLTRTCLIYIYQPSFEEVGQRQPVPILFFEDVSGSDRG